MTSHKYVIITPSRKEKLIKPSQNYSKNKQR